MKSKLLLLVFCVAAIAFNAQATVHTVSNNTFSPGQFTNLQTAIDSANAGDSIYVEPSPYDYGTINIEKQLYLFGGGGTPYTYQFNYVTQVDAVNFSANTSYPYNTADGSVFQGFYVYDGLNVGSGLKNMTVARNFFDDNLQLNGPDTGIVAINNIFTNGYYVSLSGSNPNDITALIGNNFFNSSNNGAVTMRGNNVSENGVIFANNIFYGNSMGQSNQGTFFYAVDYVTVKNNIYYCEGGNTQAFTSGCSNCNFQNNLTYSPNTAPPYGDQVLPDAGNTGSGNINDTTPDFTNGPAVYTYITSNNLYIYNWTLTVSSPGHNAGTDGTDVGIYGGPFPMPNLEAITRLPQVRQLNITNTSVAPSGTLNVNVIGTTRN